MKQDHRLAIWQRLRVWFTGRRPVVIEVRPDSLTEHVQIDWDTLTPRQREIVSLICQGYTNRQIAETLYISTATVKTHIRRIFAKFNLHSKAELRLLLSIKKKEDTPPFPNNKCIE